MFWKNVGLTAITSLFLTTGCVSTSNNEQETQITNLKSELAQSKVNISNTEQALAITLTALSTAEKETSELQKKLAQSTNSTLEKHTKNDTETKNSMQDRYLEKTILGEAEWIYVTKAKQNFKARIDTGATTSSINAIDIQRFERDGKKWVKFNIAHDEKSEPQLIEAPIVRIAKIIQSSAPDEETERPVIKLHVRIGDVVHQSEFTLTNRMHMEFPVLIGRTFMQDVVLVDVSQNYIHPKYQADNK